METTTELKKESGLEKAIQPSLDKFMEAKKEVDVIQAKVDAIAITDADTLKMATQTLSEAGQYYKALEKSKKAIKEPIIAAGKKVESVTQSLMNPLDAAIEAGKAKVLKYNNEQQALKLAEEQRILNIKNLISNIDLQLRQKIAGCTTVEQAKALQISIKEKFPPMATFAEFAELAQEVLIRNNNSVVERIAFLEESLKLSGGQKELAVQQEALRIQQEAIKSNETAINLEVQAESERSVIMVPAVSNIRKTWTFELVDINQVPKEWLMLNDDMAKLFLDENKSGLTDGQIVHGVKFYQKQSVINR